MANTKNGTYDLANISKNLTILRKKHGLSKKDVASNLDVSLRTIYDWEDGFKLPKLDNLIQIANLYHVSLDCILLQQGAFFLSRQLNFLFKELVIY